MMSSHSQYPEIATWPDGASVVVDGSATAETRFLHDAIRALRRHKILFTTTFIAVVIIGLAVAIVLPASYEASSTVLIDPSHREAVDMKDVLADVPVDPEAIASEIEILNSRELLELVSQKLNLQADPEFNPRLHSGWLHNALAGPLETINALIGTVIVRPPVPPRREISDVLDSLRRHLTIAPVGRSRAIRITFTSRQPETASSVVNTLADVYTGEHFRLRDQARREANDWISGRIQELRQKSDAAARAVEDYRAAHGLLRGKDSLIVEQEITEVNTDLTVARKQRAEAEAALANAQRAMANGHPERLAPVLSSPLIQQLRSQEAQFVARRAEVMSRVGVSHPAAIAAAAELRDVQGRINTEVQRILQSVQDAVKVAQTNENALVARMTDLRSGVGKANSLTVGLQERQREADANNALYQTFLTRWKETDPQVNSPMVNVRVLSRAVAPDQPASPNRRLISAAGVVLGLIAGAAAALSKDGLAQGVHTRSEVEKLIGSPPLGSIPFLRRPSNALQRALFEEAVASLWARIMVSRDATRPRSVLVTSAVMQEGKTMLVRSLGAIAAERGQRVLLVDADLRCSSLTAELGRKNALPGLAEIIRGEARAQDVTVRNVRNVDVIPAGASTGSPTRLLTSSAFTAFLRDAEREYDLVIIDSPPVLIGADAWVLACNAQATLLLARWGHTPPAAIAAALRQFSDVRARCAGLVLSMVDSRKNAQYDDAEMLSPTGRARQYYTHLIASR
jgi:succinoglycan biosynthesis transport protein ExoP